MEVNGTVTIESVSWDPVLTESEWTWEGERSAFSMVIAFLIGAVMLNAGVKGAFLGKIEMLGVGVSVEGRRRG